MLNLLLITQYPLPNTQVYMSTFRGLLLIIGWITIGNTAVYTQSVLDRSVNIPSGYQSIASILSSIEDQYQIFFTYSKNYIPVDNKVNLEVQKASLRNVLDEMFNATAVVYVERRGKVILKIDPVKEEELRQLSLYEEIRKRQEALISARNKEKERLRLNPMARRINNFLETPGSYTALDLDWEKYKFPPIVLEEPEEDLEPLPDMGQEKRLAQISVFPFLGTNAIASYDITNKFSLNIFWGMNGGLDGVEVGLFVNSIKKQAKGLQIAGLGNTVGGDVEGSQIAGMFNISSGKVGGVQASGLFNIAAKDFSGVQAAGIFNIANSMDSTSAVQVAGLMNVGAGKVKTQISGLFNFAEEVQGTQIAGLLNVAKKVEGLQFGLINIADTVSGVPFGLLNFIKNGYNRTEFSVNETFYGNFSLRIGVRRFYNILYIGSRLDKDRLSGNLDRQQLTLTWGLGYGFGTGITIGARNNMINLETIFIHVNEQQFWTRPLNLLNQYRLGLDIQTGAKTSIFFGPNMNIMFSKLNNEDAKTLGSNIMPYAFYDKTKGQTNVKMWLGFGAGVRF